MTLGKTKIHGNRIAEGSISNKHLAPDFAISEENIKFNMMPHKHINKTALDIIQNSIPQTLTTIDLKDVFYTILEVTDARDVNKTLRQTLQGRVSQEEFNKLMAEIDEARRGYPDLNSFITQLLSDIDAELASHMGAIEHKDLDAMYAEVKAARGTFTSLKDRLDAGGNGTGGGSMDVHMLTPWVTDVTLEAGKTIVELTNTYIPGNSTLQVFEGPLLMQANVDYIELSPTQIEFLEAFEEPVSLRIIGVNTGRLFEWERRVSGDGTAQRIELLDSYRPGCRELQVYEDGVLLREEDDYVESSPHVIVFKQPIPVNSLVTIYKRRN